MIDIEWLSMIVIPLECLDAIDVTMFLVEWLELENPFGEDGIVEDVALRGEEAAVLLGVLFMGGGVVLWIFDLDKDVFIG